MTMKSTVKKVLSTRFEDLPHSRYAQLAESTIKILITNGCYHRDNPGSPIAEDALYHDLTCSIVWFAVKSGQCEKHQITDARKGIAATEKFLTYIKAAFNDRGSVGHYVLWSSAQVHRPGHSLKTFNQSLDDIISAFNVVAHKPTAAHRPKKQHHSNAIRQSVSLIEKHNILMDKNTSRKSPVVLITSCLLEAIGEDAEPEKLLAIWRRHPKSSE